MNGPAMCELRNLIELAFYSERRLDSAPSQPR